MRGNEISVMLGKLIGFDLSQELIVSKGRSKPRRNVRLALGSVYTSHFSRVELK